MGNDHDVSSHQTAILVVRAVGLVLSDKLNKLQSLNIAKGCPVALFKETSPEDGQAIMDALDGVVSIVQIHKLLVNEGIFISRDRLYAHRKHDCSCFRNITK